MGRVWGDRFCRTDRPAARGGLLLLGLLGTAFVLAGPASAHAGFTGSTPRDGARLATAPASVTIRFDDVVDPAFIHVTSRSGVRADVGPVTHPNGNGDRVTVRLRPHLPAGTYVAEYRVVADDGHPVGGAISFVVGSGPLVAPSAPDLTDSVVSAALDLSRWLSFTGFTLLGGTWLLLTVWRSGGEQRRPRRLVQAGWAAAVIGSVAELLLEGAYVAGRGIGATFDPALISDTLHQNYGLLHAVRLGLLLLLAITPPRLFFWPLMLGVAFTFSAAGHARTTDPEWLSIALDMLHVLAIAAWIGGVVMILVGLLPRAQADVLPKVLPVYSRVAFTAVTVIAVTGSYAAWRGIGTWRAVLQTEYGLLVCAKVLGFVGLIAVGNLSRRVVQRRSFGATEVEQLRRCVLVETVVAAIVLALAAVLVSQPQGFEALGSVR